MILVVACIGSTSCSSNDQSSRQLSGSFETTSASDIEASIAPSTLPTTSGESTTSADSEAAVVSLPAIALGDTSAIKDYLAGAGAPLVALLDVSASFVAKAADSSSCQQALSGLSAGPSPSELHDVAAVAPDVVLSAAFSTLIAVSNQFLTTCAQSAEGDTSVASRLAALVTLLQRRIRDVG